MPDQDYTNPAAAAAPVMNGAGVDDGAAAVSTVDSTMVPPTSPVSTQDNTTGVQVDDYAAPIQSDAVVVPNSPDTVVSDGVNSAKPSIYNEIINKISDAHNVLIALSGDPSVDELAAAIGLSLYLDKLGKRATAIYSGHTPNALEFLKPEETFEPTVDALQDFVIALNKDKADHLRYKLDGDYVKIYITPYRTRIAEDDLDFSYGDFNVDLVLALDVANGIDLDSALREHGRIMHDAVIINVTTGNPGKFGEIEWSDKSASSISEMVAKFLLNVRSKVEVGKEEATAFLTGIVAATNRFSNSFTTPETMRVSSRLMEAGANQQLISRNITPDIENEMISFTEKAPLEKKTKSKTKTKREEDPTKLDIEHGNEEGADESKVVDDVITEKESTLLDDLKAAEASLSQAGAETTPDTSDQPVKLDELSDNESSVSEPSSEPEVKADVSDEPEVKPDTEPSNETNDTSSSNESSEPVLPPVITESGDFASPEGDNAASDAGDASSTTSGLSETVIQPPTSFDAGEPGVGSAVDGADKYGKMLEDALAGAGIATEPTNAAMDNPATSSAPTVPDKPEINGVPSMNYMPMPDETILPPPPAPPIDMGNGGFEMPAVQSAPFEPAAPVPQPAPQPLGPQPAMQDQVYNPQAADPGAFKIPGM